MLRPIVGWDVYALGYRSTTLKRRIGRFVEFVRRHGPRPADDTWLAEWRQLDAATLEEVHPNRLAAPAPVMAVPARA